MISDGFKLCYCMFTSNDIRRFQAVLFVCLHPMISDGFKLCYCMFHPMISDGFKLCYCMFTSNDIRRFQLVLLYVHIKLYQKVSSCVNVCSH